MNNHILNTKLGKLFLIRDKHGLLVIDSSGEDSLIEHNELILFINYKIINAVSIVIYYIFYKGKIYTRVTGYRFSELFQLYE